MRRPVSNLLLRHDAVDFCKESTQVRAPGAQPPTGTVLSKLSKNMPEPKKERI